MIKHSAEYNKTNSAAWSYFDALILCGNAYDRLEDDCMELSNLSVEEEAQKLEGKLKCDRICRYLSKKFDELYASLAAATPPPQNLILYVTYFPKQINGVIVDQYYVTIFDKSTITDTLPTKPYFRIGCSDFFDREPTFFKSPDEAKVAVYSVGYKHVAFQ